MSRWTENKRFYSKHGNDIWITTPNIYIVTTDQCTFKVERYKLDYKQTIINLKKAGYTNINICCIGRNVTF